MSFRYKTILGVALIEASLLIFLVWSTIGMMRSSNESLLLQRADSSTQLFVAMIKDPILSFDLATLETSVEQLLTGDGVSYVKVWGYDQLLTHGGLMQAPSSSEGSSAQTGFDKTGDLYRVVTDVGVAGEKYGQVEIGFDAAQMQASLTEALQSASVVAFVEIILSALFSFLLGTWLVRQLEDLRDASKAISQGEYGVQIPVRGKDEIAETASLFNNMSKDLQTATQELLDLNQSLEQQVVNRTAELVYSKQSLENIIQAMSDAMVVVNPAGEVVRANPAFHSITNIPTQQLAGYSLSKIFKQKGHLQGVELVLSTTFQQREMQLINIAGSDIPVMVSVAKVEFDGEIDWLLTMQDLRAIKRAEEIEREEAYSEGVQETRIDVNQALSVGLSNILVQTDAMQQQADLLKSLQKSLHHYQHNIHASTLGEGTTDALDVDKIESVLHKAEQLIGELLTSGIEQPSAEIAMQVKQLSSEFSLPTQQKTKLATKFSLKDLLRNAELEMFSELDMAKCFVHLVVKHDVDVRNVPRNMLYHAILDIFSAAMKALITGGSITVDMQQKDFSLELVFDIEGVQPIAANAAGEGQSSQQVDFTSLESDLAEVRALMVKLDGEFDIKVQAYRGAKIRLAIPQLGLV